MLTLYGVRRLVESTRGVEVIEPEAPGDADAIEVGSDTEVFDQD